MYRNSSRWLAATALFLGVVAAACGSSAATPTAPPSAATPTANAPATAAGPAATNITTAGTDCPTAAKIGGALGITVNKPVRVDAATGGARGLSCDYAGKSFNVIVEVLTNAGSSDLDQFSSKFPVAYTSVPGVGDQARSFRQSLNGGKDNEGVVALKGSTLVAVTATATAASLQQVEALVSQLL